YLAGLCLLAQEKDDLLSLDLESLLNIAVTSASKSSETARLAPSVIHVMRDPQHSAFGYQSINDILYSLPGFGPGQDFDRATVPTRGVFDSWAGSHLLMLIDGIPINDNLYGTAYTWEITPLFLAKTLEIIRGPGSALYGSNAMNGVIQMNSPTADALAGQIHFGVESGQNQTFQLQVLAGQDFNWLDAVFGFAARETDGVSYPSLDGSGRLDADGQLQAYPLRDDQAHQYFWFKLAFQHKLKGLEFQFHHQEWDFQTGHGWLWWIPDFRENMQEQRQLASLRYRRGSQIKTEWVLRFQNHEIQWNQRYFPNGAFDDYYPAGLWEYLDTNAQDWFARVQASQSFAADQQWLLGWESVRFLYNGDHSHTSNVDLDDPLYPPFPQNQTQSLGPWLDYILDRPLQNQALFVQYVSGSLWGRLKATLGLRWDELKLDYQAIDQPGQPDKHRSFAKLSPRFALVGQLGSKGVFKLLAGRAFRTPLPTELAGAHTFSLASNIEQLQAEWVESLELAYEHRLGQAWVLRNNVFLNRFANQIAYSTAANNLSTNILSQKHWGLEGELRFQKGLQEGYFNASWVDRLDETALDGSIKEQAQLTWDSPWKLNAGYSRTSGSWRLGGQAHYQAGIRRRDQDVGTQALIFSDGIVVDLDSYRRRELGGWLRIDGQISYVLGRHVELKLRVHNLLDRDYALIKTGPYPFDYQQAGRQLFLGFHLQ
ncbi:MAG: TonB-dependent receptor, partial [Acidobacteria bacterium]|nr:TonB-dependent receptor [Acidobacteriota bacterium]